MVLQCLICIPQPDDSALAGLQSLRDLLRAAVHRAPTLGAAVLFTGSSTLLMVEGDDVQVHSLKRQVLSSEPDAENYAWLLHSGTDTGRVLMPGRCQMAYLELDDACEELLRMGGTAVAQVQAFLRLLARSDHD